MAISMGCSTKVCRIVVVFSINSLMMAPWLKLHLVVDEEFMSHRVLQLAEIPKDASMKPDGQDP